MKNLKSLKDHNSSLNIGHYPSSTPWLNGIACPDCGSELVDPFPDQILTSIPPQKNVKCSNSKCNFVGYRFC